MSEVKDKIVIITGASSGIGRETALHFALLGAKVIICFSNNERGAKETQMLCKDAQTFIQKVDVTNEQDVLTLFETCKEYFNGEPDILVCNVGISNIGRGSQLITETSTDDFLNVLHVNTLGVLLCCKQFMKCNKKEYARKIVIVSSVRSKLLLDGYIAYNASKAAVEMMMKNIANEVCQNDMNINVNCIAPGKTLTRMYQDAIDDKNVQSKYVTDIPMRRFGEVNDIANGIVFLASSAANYIHGTTLVVDGGLSVK